VEERIGRFVVDALKSSEPFTWYNQRTVAQIIITQNPDLECSGMFRSRYNYLGPTGSCYITVCKTLEQLLGYRIPDKFSVETRVVGKIKEFCLVPLATNDVQKPKVYKICRECKQRKRPRDFYNGRSDCIDCFKADRRERYRREKYSDKKRTDRVPDNVENEDLVEDTLVEDDVMEDIVEDIVEDTVMEDTLAKNTVMEDNVVEDNVVEDNVMEDTIIDTITLQDTVIDTNNAANNVPTSTKRLEPVNITPTPKVNKADYLKSIATWAENEGKRIGYNMKLVEVGSTIDNMMYLSSRNRVKHHHVTTYVPDIHTIYNTQYTQYTHTQ
jgi:hypothetical protein